MLSFDVFRVSSRSFKNNRLRTFLTILGISVGIGTIFFLVTLGYGLQKLIIENIASQDTLLALDITKKSEAMELDKSGLEAIQAIPEVDKALPVINRNTTLENGALSSSVNVSLVDKDYFSLEGIELQKGEFFSKEEEGVLISPTVLELLGVDRANSLGKKIVVYLRKNGNSAENFIKKEFEIKGILQKTEKAVAYIPRLSVIEEIDVDKYDKIKVRSVSDNQISIARDKIIQQGFHVSSISELVEQAKQVFKVVNIMLVLFGTVALIVSAIGMFNTMTIALLERTQEIGTMKALGAARKDIWKMFLMESMLIGFMGGTGGLVIGYLLSKILNFAVNILAKNFGGLEVNLFYFPIWFIFFVVIFSTVVGLITGFYPAKRAAKLNALEALRYK